MQTQMYQDHDWNDGRYRFEEIHDEIGNLKFNVHTPEYGSFIMVLDENAVWKNEDQSLNIPKVLLEELGEIIDGHYM